MCIDSMCIRCTSSLCHALTVRFYGWLFVAGPGRGPGAGQASARVMQAPEFGRSTEDAVDALFEALFPLFDRDHSGFADHTDVIAALQCAVHTPEEAVRALARVSESGHVDEPRLRQLLQSCVPLLPQWPSPAAEHVRDVDSRHVQLVKFALAIVRDFEKRATERGQFVAAAQARDVGRQIREAEQQRAFQMLEDRKLMQRSTLRKGQAHEANDFNEAWTGRMGEFNKHAKRAVEALREQHEAAVGELLETQRPVLLEHFKQHHRSKEALDCLKTIERFASAGEYTQAYEREQVYEGLVRRDGQDAENLAEIELQKRLGVMRWQQKLEVRALMTKIERIRSEHRGQWEDGLSKLVLSQRTMLSELNSRQHRETRQTAKAVRSMLEPSLVPADRNPHVLHSNLALLSPRASTPRGSHAREQRGGDRQPPQRGGGTPILLQRPSRMLHPPMLKPGIKPGMRTGRAVTAHDMTARPASHGSPRRLASAEAGSYPSSVPSSPNSAFPPRLFTSEHIPATSPRAKLTPRSLQSR